MERPSLSIGIEEEYQTIDPETRDLRSHIASEILPKAKLALHEAVKAGDAPGRHRGGNQGLP